MQSIYPYYKTQRGRGKTEEAENPKRRQERAMKKALSLKSGKAYRKWKKWQRAAIKTEAKQ